MDCYVAWFALGLSAAEMWTTITVHQLNATLANTLCPC